MPSIGVATFISRLYLSTMAHNCIALVATILSVSLHHLMPNDPISEHKVRHTFSASTGGKDGMDDTALDVALHALGLRDSDKASAWKRIVSAHPRPLLLSLEEWVDVCRDVHYVRRSASKHNRIVEFLFSWGQRRERQRNQRLMEESYRYAAQSAAHARAQPLHSKPQPYDTCSAPAEEGVPAAGQVSKRLVRKQAAAQGIERSLSSDLLVIDSHSLPDDALEHNSQGQGTRPGPPRPHSPSLMCRPHSHMPLSPSVETHDQAHSASEVATDVGVALGQTQAQVQAEIVAVFGVAFGQNGHRHGCRTHEQAKIQTPAPSIGMTAASLPTVSQESLPTVSQDSWHAAAEMGRALAGASSSPAGEEQDHLAGKQQRQDASAAKEERQVEKMHHCSSFVDVDVQMAENTTERIGSSCSPMRSLLLVPSRRLLLSPFLPYPLPVPSPSLCLSLFFSSWTRRDDPFSLAACVKRIDIALDSMGIDTGRFVGATIDKYATQFLLMSFTLHLLVEYLIIEFQEMRGEPILGARIAQSLIDHRGLDVDYLGLG